MGAALDASGPPTAPGMSSAPTSAKKNDPVLSWASRAAGLQGHRGLVSEGDLGTVTWAPSHQ